MARTAGDASAGIRGPVAFRLTAAAVGVVALVVFALGVLVSIVLPYGDWDAMAFGIWSRLIAADWPHIRFAAVGAADYHRPLFFFLQGSLWRVFGFHEALGRLLSLAFAVLLGASVAFIAWRSVARRYAELAAAAALALLLIVASFERYIVSGLTDIPVAAMLALTAALLYANRLGRAQLPLIGLAACLSLLTKPSALIALIGLGAAVLIGPRADLRRRLLGVGAIAGGTAAALVYDLIQARYVHMSLRAFMTEGTGGFYAALSSRLRHDVLLGTSWLGADLRLVLTFTIVYALVRVVPRSHIESRSGSAFRSHFSGRGSGRISPAPAAASCPEAKARGSGSLFSCSQRHCSLRSRLQVTPSPADSSWCACSCGSPRPSSSGRGTRCTTIDSRPRRGRHSSS